MENQKGIVSFLQKTPKKIKWLLVFILAIIPMLILIIGFNTESHQSNWVTIEYGITWAISMTVFVLDIIILLSLVKYTKQIKIDVLPFIIGVLWYFIAWYTLYDFIGWWNLIVAPIFSSVFYFIAFVVVLGTIFYKEKKKIDKVMESFSGTTGKGEVPEAFKNIFQQGANPGARGTSTTIKDLDEALKKEGIDIEALDKQFGTFFENNKANPSNQKVTSFEDEEILELFESDIKEEPKEKIITRTTIDDEEIIESEVVEKYSNKEDKEKKIIDQK